MQSCFNGQLRKLEKQTELSLGSCWEIGTVSEMKHTSWTSRIPSENDSSSLCSTFFTSDFFVAFDERNWSNSSKKELSEVNVKFVATWLKQWQKEIMAKMCSNCYSLFYIRLRLSRKGKTIHEKSCQSIFFTLKTDYLHLKTSYKDESACLWRQLKQLKWNKYSFMVTDCLGNLFTGINVTKSVSEKITQEKQCPLIRQQDVWIN